MKKESSFSYKVGFIIFVFAIATGILYIVYQVISLIAIYDFVKPDIFKFLAVSSTIISLVFIYLWDELNENPS